MAGHECDECGADGTDLLCICEKEKPRDKAKPARARPAREPDVAPRSDVPVQRVQDSKGRPAAAPRAPQETTYRGHQVICCRCKNVHNDGDRLNEWGLKAGKVMAGRRTECPKGCGYHRPVP